MTFLSTDSFNRLGLVIALAAIAAVILVIALQTHQDTEGSLGLPAENFATGNSDKERVSAVREMPSVASPIRENRDDSHAMGVDKKENVALEERDDNAKPLVGHRTPEQAIAAVQAVETKVFSTAKRFFETEAVDHEWAAEYETVLSTMFANQPGMDRVSVSQMECRSSMCRIVVFTPHSRDADYFTSVFYDALENFDGGKYKTTAAITRNMANGITAVYVSRKNHALKFYQELTY